MKLYFDTNVLIDAFTNRDKESEFSTFCFRLVQRDLAKGYINAKQLSDIFYVMNKCLGKEEALDCIDIISSLFVVVPFTKNSLTNEHAKKFNDLEDGSIDNSAKEFCCDYLLTRNTKHFSNSDNKVLTPKEFVNIYNVIREK